MAGLSPRGYGIGSKLVCIIGCGSKPGLPSRGGGIGLHVAFIAAGRFINQGRRFPDRGASVSSFACIMADRFVIPRRGVSNRSSPE